MKRFAVFFLLVARFILPVRGDDAHLARFDVTRVIEQYQRTKEFKAETMAAINHSKNDPVQRDQALREKILRHLAELTDDSKEANLPGPRGMHLRTAQEAITAQLALDDARRALAPASPDLIDGSGLGRLQRQIAELEARIKQAAPDSPERERLTLELQVANDHLKMDTAWQAMERIERELSFYDDVRLQRARILNEIWAVAAKLRAERGFALLVPVNGPDEDEFLTVIVPADCEDVTDALLARLNGGYAAKKGK